MKQPHRHKLRSHTGEANYGRQYLMTNRTPTGQPELQERRAATLLSIVELAKTHDLPVPLHIDMFDHGTVQLRLHDEDYAGVAAWAAVLALGPIRTFDVPRSTCDFVSVKTERRYDGEPGWCGWEMVDVWAACWRDMPVRATDDTSGGVA
jgi:hypothetical protein